MVRPLSGGNPKKVVSITMDPAAWETFKTLVDANMPDGDKSPSSHVETLIKEWDMGRNKKIHVKQY